LGKAKGRKRLLPSSRARAKRMLGISPVVEPAPVTRAGVDLVVVVTVKFFS